MKLLSPWDLNLGLGKHETIFCITFFICIVFLICYTFNREAFAKHGWKTGWKHFRNKKR